MYLFFDTETTGKVKNWKAPVTDLDNWPRITQIAWQVYDEDGNLLREFCSLIKPDGWEIPDEEFFRENNMSTERCEREGVPLGEILKDFIEQANGAKHLIAHNINFDDSVVRAEMIRSGLEMNSEINKICTMRESINFCQLPGMYGKYKFPSLTELYNNLFSEGFDGAHDAIADVSATARCFFKLKEQGVLLNS